MHLSVQEKKFKIDYEDGNCGSHLVFPVGMILAIFDRQVTLMLSAKVLVIRPYGSGGEAQN